MSALDHGSFEGLSPQGSASATEPGAGGMLSATSTSEGPLQKQSGTGGAGSYPGPEKLTRNTRRGIIGGVAAGLGEYLGVRPTTVRIVLCALTALGFIGVVFYGIAWANLPARGTQKPPRGAEKVALISKGAAEQERRNGYFLVGVGLLGALVAMLTLMLNFLSVAVPLLVVGVGAGLVWKEFDRVGDEETPEPTLLAFMQDRFALARIVGGIALVVIGVSVVLVREVDVAQLGSSFVALTVAIGGVALLTVPLWMRMLRTVETERAARVREQERANIASHLHDSVLQTLALIQKRADDPGAVTKLARRQERELRQWLFEAGDRSRNDPQSVAAAVERIAEEVEDTFELQVSQVVVGGDVPLGENEAAALAAARECLVNVAKHAGVDRADVFCEVLAPEDGGGLELFVRDRGCGFDPEAVSDDRQGLALSVRRRVESRGGTVRVRSTLGSGTEVSLRVPRSGEREAETSE